MMQRCWPLQGPLTWITYVTKQVKVKAGRGEEHRGWLLSVDPVSASLVLVTFAGGGAASVKVVMGHAVEEVQVLQEADQEITERLQSVFLLPSSQRLNTEDQSIRKDRVRTWLERNLVPVEEEGTELKVAGVLTITPPYTSEDCCSSNQIILDRIQKLIQNQPDPPESPESFKD